jgi:hypothetical protein
MAAILKAKQPGLPEAKALTDTTCSSSSPSRTPQKVQQFGKSSGVLSMTVTHPPMPGTPGASLVRIPPVPSKGKENMKTNLR